MSEEKKPLKFGIEQIAIVPRDPAKAKELLIALGLVTWVEDQVSAVGECFGQEIQSVANLSFNYEAFSGKEFEVLEYVQDDNWINHNAQGYRRENTVSHLGMHCSDEDLVRWREFFAARDIGVAQEVVTTDHTNPFLINNGRTFNYVIFDTKAILGVDLKFIVRIEKEENNA